MRISISTLLLLLFSFGVRSQQIWYVNVQANGTATGLNWENAFPGLQNALQNAVAGDQIWVAKGAYKPTEDNDRYRTFDLKNGVKIYGGFAGNESVLSERNWLTNLCILSGNIGNPAISTDNSMHVLTGYDLDENTILDGFTIEKGYSEEDYGAGLALISNSGISNPVIANCRFLRNFAFSGGAVFAGSFGENNYAQPQFRNCIFERNRAYELGGAFLKSGPTPPGDTFLFKDCRFSDNAIYPFGRGGALYFDETKNSAIRLLGCTFERDSSWEGGAITSAPTLPGYFTVSITLDSCTFYRNWALEGGGLHYRELNGQGNKLQLTIRNCQFNENIAQNSAGALYTIDMSDDAEIEVNIELSTFYRNNYNTGVGSAKIVAYNNSKITQRIDRCRYIENSRYPVSCQLEGASNYNESETLVTNCLFVKNRAGVASSSTAENNYANTVIRNCTFFRNGTRAVYKVLYPSYKFSTDTFNNKMLIENSIIWDPEYDPLLLYVNHTPTEPLYFPTGWGFTFRNCLVPFNPIDTMGTPGGDFYENNFFNIFPEFLDTLSGSYELSPCSPLVNKGYNAGVLEQSLLTDLEGQPRIFGDTVDIGAYEQQDICISGTNAASNTASQLVISPNPSMHESISLKLPAVNWANGIITIFNSQGILVFQKECGIKQEEQLNIGTSLPAGIYLIVAASGGERWFGRWVKMAG